VYRRTGEVLNRDLCLKMDLGEAYRTWSRVIALSLPLLERFLYSVPACTLSQRKALLAATRVQSYPHRGSRVYQRMKEEWESMVILEAEWQSPSYQDRLYRPVHERLIDIAGWVKPYFHSPITAGFLSSVIRSAPAPDPSFLEARSISLVKEVQASLAIYHPIILNYRCIFGEDPHDRLIPLSVNLESCPPVAIAIHNAFSSMRTSMNNRILFPKTSPKTVGHMVADNFKEMAPPGFLAEWNDEIEIAGVTTRMLERLHFYEGIIVDGPVEVRTAWKYNDLKPRVYFAQGGSTFQSSKYVQDIFNSIADTLEVVHTKNRFFKPTEELTKTDSLIIYDYASFTSTIQEIVSFLNELSNFFRGVNVFLVQGRGLIAKDLGELLAEYNQECSVYAEFDLGRVAKFDDEAPFLLGHSCGMLGIPGNIMSCTILHGIHLAFISQSLNNCRCVGDDALFFRQIDNRLDKMILEAQLQNIGQVTMEKTEFFEYDIEDDYDLRAWQFTKRPLLRCFNRIISYWLTTFPTLDCLIGLNDRNRTTLPGSLTLHSRRKKFFNIWTRLLFQMWSQGGALDEDERDFLSIFQKRAFKDLEILRLRVGVHSDGNGNRFHVPLYLQREEFGEDPLSFVARDYLFEEEVEVPCTASFSQGPHGFVGEVFQSRSLRILSYLCAMGVLSNKMLFEVVSRSLLGDGLFSRRILGLEPVQYEYTVLRHIPTWMHSLMPVAY